MSVLNEITDWEVLKKPNLKVKIKRLHADAVIPTYAKPGDAGLDLVAVDINTDAPAYVEYRTGLAFEIPEGYVGLLFPRSSVSKKDLILTNCVGVIDSGYRGEVTFRFRDLGVRWYKVGDRIGQLIIMPYPSIEFEEAEELSQTERGKGGYGSTGS